MMSALWINHHCCEFSRQGRPDRWRSRLWWLLLLGSCFVLAARPVLAQQATAADAAPLPVILSTVPVDGFLTDFVLDRGHNRIYLTDESGMLTVVDATAYRVIKTLPFTGKLTLDPSYPLLYVTPAYRRSAEPSAIQVIDTTTLTVTATITNATDIALDPTHGRVFVGNALYRPAPPNPALGGLRVLDAKTLTSMAEAPLDGIPVYNPVRDELLLVADSLFRLDPATLEVRQDLFPAITAQPCKDCIGIEQIASVQVLAEQKLLALDMQVHSTPTGGRLLPPFRFLEADTYANVPTTAAPPVQPTCGRRAVLQPLVDNRIYRHQAYASTFLFHTWRIETAAGKLLQTVEGLAPPFINANTHQAYTGNWVLALPTLQPVGRMPTLTCIFAQDVEQGLLYAQRAQEFVILTETGEPAPVTLPATALTALPPEPISQIVVPANLEQSNTLFVVQADKLYRSTDGGASWLPLTTLPLYDTVGLHIGVSPNFADDQTLFAGGGDMVSSAESAGGIFRSVDSGDSWQPRWQGLQHLRIDEVAVSPHFAEDQTVLAYANYMQFDPMNDGKSVQRSTDGGLTWSLWITMTDGPLPAATALLPAATPPPVLPMRLSQYGDELLRQRHEDGTWESIDLDSTLGSTARALVAAPDFAETGVVYVMGEHALWRLREAGTVIESGVDPRLSGHQTASAALTSLAVSPLYRDGSHRLVIGTAGGAVWLLHPDAMTWQAPATVSAAAVAPLEIEGTLQPLLTYTITQAGRTQLILRAMDGAQRRAVTMPPELATRRDFSLSPDGQWLAYYTGAVSRPDAPASDDLTLHLLSIEEGTALTVTPLLPPNFPANLDLNAQRIAERLPEVARDPQLREGIWWGFAEALTVHAWSPDGKQLAFAGAMDGPSSDLYLYHIENRTLRRLTDGPEQLTAIRWSPDGQWIWHSSIAVGFCQGCFGHNYAAAADGSRMVTLPGDDSDRFVAWLGPDRYLASEQANGLGDYHLYEVKVNGQPGRDVWTGKYSAFVLNRTQQRMVIVGAPNRTITPEGVGLYDVDLTTGQFITTSRDYLLPDVANRLTRPPVLPCPFGETLIVYPCDPTAASPYAPDGRWRVTPDLTLRTVDGRLLLPNATQQQAKTIFWRRDSAGFYFLAAGDLYYRPLLESWPLLIEQGVSRLAWVE